MPARKLSFYIYILQVDLWSPGASSFLCYLTPAQQNPLSDLNLSLNPEMPVYDEIYDIK